MGAKYRGIGGYQSKRDRDFRPDRGARNKNLGREPGPPKVAFDLADETHRLKYRSVEKHAAEYSKKFSDFIPPPRKPSKFSGYTLFGIDAYKTPKRPKYPELADIEGKDVHVDLSHMTGNPIGTCTWSAAWDCWYVDASIEIMNMVTKRTDRLHAGALAYSRELVLDRMRDTGHNALRVLGEAVRGQAATLYMHELDECLRVGLTPTETHRVRNPHPQTFTFYPQAQYAHALDDQ